MKFIWLKIFVAALTFTSLSQAQQQKSVARLWNEQVLNAIRKDYARPTVAARNLFHMSMIAYDAWAMYDKSVKNYYYNQKHEALDLEKARMETTSMASYLLILHRFQKSLHREEINASARQLAQQLGVDVDTTPPAASPLAIGNQLAQMIIDYGASDQSLESVNYETPPLEFAPLNPPLMVAFNGVGALKNVNFWQPLALESYIDQGGNPMPNNIQAPLTLHWGRVRPFALTEQDKNSQNNVYFDPGMPPLWNGKGHKEFVDSMVQVIEYSSWLDPQDQVQIDISPKSFGNNPLGRNDGPGHSANPATGLPYESKKVLRGDFARVLAEFWADGPQSETPPGHWNVVANSVCDHPLFEKKWMGRKQIQTPLEWDVKMYLALNGALHDTAIAVWGIKGYYQGSRPITAIRFLAALGQSTDPTQSSYHPLGLPLVDNLIAVVTEKDTEPGQRFSHLVGHEGKIAIRSWQGAPAPLRANKGVDWILGEEWIPYQKPTFVTPPFPGYVSGHSGYSRAAAEVLSAITGNSYFPGGMGVYNFKANQYLSFEQGPSRDISLQWATYFDAADQSALSRIFGGIHGNIDDIPSRKIGHKIGRRAVSKAQFIFKE